MQIERQAARADGLKPDALSEMLWRFAARVGKVVDALPDTRLGRHVASQLVRSGTSAPPNYDEACAAESRADFAHKVSIALKEAKESRGWLRFTSLAGLLPEKRTTGVFDECEQLCKISRKISRDGQAQLARFAAALSVGNHNVKFSIFTSPI